MNIKLPIKFTDREIDEFINTVYLNHTQFPNTKYTFDFTEVEYIANQELLILSALFKSFYESNIDFEILFTKQGVSAEKIGDRVKRQIIQFWEVWQIWRIIPNGDFRKYFGIESSSSIDILKAELKYYPKLSEIYTRHGITPFISLNYINNYSELEVQKLIQPIYKLNSVIESLLKTGKCTHPFTSNSLSAIITEELYLNFLDHSKESSFVGFKQNAFMSISFQAKLDENKNTFSEIQKRKKLNFQTECLEETINFFYDQKKEKFRNDSYIQFSFLDFGQGISKTLKDQFIQQHSDSKINFNDSDILKYAFNHDSSRHPIFDAENKIEKLVPRGLFDALSIVKRYNGLLVVRSNNGKILFDFSVSKEIDKALKYFGNNKLYFPGTLISLYLPAIEQLNEINISSIKPELVFSKIKPDNKKYVSIKSITDKLVVDKEILYSTLLKELKNEICNDHLNSLAIISFRGCEQIEKRIVKKIVYFLLSNYDINLTNNVIIINPPPRDIVEEMFSEINSLNNAIKNYKIHPLPLVYFDTKLDEVSIDWLGVFNNEDKNKLNELLLEGYTTRKSDFKDPSNIIGHLNNFDVYGNLQSNLPSRDEIIHFYKNEKNILDSLEVERLLLKHDCIKKDNTTSLYLCNGNYYQKEYIALNNLINHKNDCNIVSQLLFEKISKHIPSLSQYKFIGITSSSQKLIKSFEYHGFIEIDNYITLDNYHTIETEIEKEVINEGDKFILLCDVTSTGFLTKRLNDKLNKIGASIEFIAVIVSIFDSNFEATKTFVKDYENKIIYLHKYPIIKHTRESVYKEIIDKEIIRINPHTNIPITLSIRETNYNESIIFPTKISYDKTNNEININNKFLDSISSDAISVGFYKFNNAIHPYFFNTNEILYSISEDLLKEITQKINNNSLTQDNVEIFYPKKSGIERFQFDKIRNVLKNNSIVEFEIERFGTHEGWRFPHNTSYLDQKINNNVCFILDDGSCSGDSLIQMIDEISFHSAKEIILLCFIGRVNDHKRELFSRMSSIKVKNKISIPISIYFATHWHIPTYYLDENPNTKETTWLNEISNIQNTPQSIKSIANRIINEINPKGKDDFKDYKYLPKVKTTSLIPKKELILIREEVGKVIGYRLYKESFKFFDFFIKKYETKKHSIERYKEIELLCATFLFEPYLYEKVVGILPDVVSKIEDFVRALITPNAKVYENLFYKWKKIDIVHLFFIVFKDEKLISELTTHRFKELIEFTKQAEQTINYILYKLLKYFPLIPAQFLEKKYDLQIKNLITILKDEPTISNKEIKKIHNFIVSLPSRNDFESQLSCVYEIYQKEKQKEYHDERKSFGHNVTEFIVTIKSIILSTKAEQPIPSASISTLRLCWYKILNFINPILSFSISYSDYLLPYTYYELTNNVNMLRQMVGFIEDAISHNEYFIDIEKLENIRKSMIRIQTDFQLNTVFHKLIEKPQSNLQDFISSLKKEISSNYSINEVGKIDFNIKNIISIPQLYIDKLLISELSTNMKKYCLIDKNSKIVFTYTFLSENTFQLQIANGILKKDSKDSNGEGIRCINHMQGSTLFGFKYNAISDENNFIQTLTFNLL